MVQTALTQFAPTSQPTSQGPDYIALAMVGVLALILLVLVIRKWLQNRAADKKSIPVVESEITLVDQGEPVIAPGTGGELKLKNVEPKTAALLMAMVADQMEKPLSELRFISIEEVQNDEV